MTFTSFNFLIFFPLVVLFYNIVPNKGKSIFLLLVSYFFYINMQPIYAILLLGVTTVTYFGAKFIARENNDKRRNRFLTISIILVLLPLILYKYFGFINEGISTLLNGIGIGISLPQIKYLLPVGISFYTFMAIGYLIDVNNEEVDFEKSFVNTSLFLSFFPIILSGPIERAKNMFTQYSHLKNSTYKDISSGFKLLLWGCFMKVCVADNLALYVDTIFNNIPNHNGKTILFASILYPIQLYTDFGGYSTMAIGAAKCMGINVIKNFNRPFLATSMSGLWRRWHISLIKWITDYIYTPLAFILRGWEIYGTITAILLAFLISGLWHGAAMTFIVWGLIQGAFLSIEASTKQWRDNLESKHNLNKKWWYVLPCMIGVFTLFAFSQIFAKSPNLSEANIAIQKIFCEHGILYLPESKSIILFGLFSFIIVLFKDLKDEYNLDRYKLINSKNKIVSYISCILITIMIMLMGMLDGGQFIYFQF